MPDVKLAGQGFLWVNRRLEEAFIRHGKLSQLDFKRLDWPS